MSEYPGKHGSETEWQRGQLRHMESPYREGTKLDRIFLFMQNGCWHTRNEITTAAYRGTIVTWVTPRKSRTASALRTIRSHPKLNVRYDCDRGYCLEFSAIEQARRSAVVYQPC